MKVLLSIRRSLALSQHEIALKISRESGHHITRGYVSVIERGLVEPPIWLLIWVGQQGSEPLVGPAPICPIHGEIHLIDCHGKSGIASWRQPRRRCVAIHEDWVERYREVVPCPRPNHC